MVILLKRNQYKKPPQVTCIVIFDFNLDYNMDI